MQSCPTLGTFIISNHSGSSASGHRLILPAPTPTAWKISPIHCKLLCSVGSRPSWRRPASLLLCFKNTNPTDWIPSWTQSPASIWPWLLWGSGRGPPQRLSQCLLLKTNGGLASLEDTKLLLTKKVVSHPSPVPTPSTDPSVPMMSFPVMATGSSLSKRANGAGTCTPRGVPMLL